jgi:hypothetical protein
MDAYFGAFSPSSQGLSPVIYNALFLRSSLQPSPAINRHYATDLHLNLRHGTVSPSALPFVEL